MNRSFLAETSVMLMFVSSISLAQSVNVIETWEANIKANPNAIAVDSAEKLADAILRDHLQKKGASVPLIVINNVGPSDSEFQNKDAVAQNAQSEVEQLAQKNKGATINMVAGNTNTGVGRVVTAVQDAIFMAKMQALGVTVQTAGISGALAATNHASYSSPGNPFMNTGLDFTALIIGNDGKATWDAKLEATAISEVVRFSLALPVQSAANGMNVQSHFVVREGGEIGMREAIEFLVELKRIKETREYTNSKGEKVAVSWENLKDRVKFVLEPGHLSGTKADEIAKDKGPRGATDLALTLAALANSREYRALINEINFELRSIDANGNVTSVQTEKHALERFAQQFLSTAEGSSLAQQAEELRKLKAEGNTAAVDERIKTPSADDVNALRKAINGGAAERTGELLEIQSRKRLAAFATSGQTFTTVLQASAQRAEVAGQTSWSRSLGRMTRVALTGLRLAIVDGKIVDTKPEALKMVERAAKK